jgi:hypothetical protein
VDAGEALDRFVEQQQGHDEGGEFAAGHGTGFDLGAGVGQQADDGERAEKFDDGRGQRLKGDIAEVGAFEAAGGLPEALAFELFG